jgi:hypothetical protein
MKERPIIFTSASVRAILAGRKTQTRRVVKDAPSWAREAGFSCFTPEGKWSFRGTHPLNGPAEKFIRCPYGVPGDRLWVRETWQAGQVLDDLDAAGIARRCEEANYLRPWAPILYPSTGAMVNGDVMRDFGGPGRLRPSIHMPRWASRLLLEVTDVRVQRVQEISYPDVIAEGLHEWLTDEQQTDSAHRHAAREAFARLWDSINAKPKPHRDKDGRVDYYVSYPLWDDIGETRTYRGKPWHVIGNPWVWAVTVRRLDEGR